MQGKLIGHVGLGYLLTCKCRDAYMGCLECILRTCMLALNFWKHASASGSQCVFLNCLVTSRSFKQRSLVNKSDYGMSRGGCRLEPNT